MAPPGVTRCVMAVTHDCGRRWCWLQRQPSGHARERRSAAWLGLDVGHTVAGALLRGLDFFELWSAALLGLGVNVVAGMRSPLPYVVAFGGHVMATAIGAIGPAFT